MLQRLKEKICKEFQAYNIPEAVGRLALLAADIISVIAAVIGWIFFGVRGGYATQIGIVRENGILAFELLFTKGTVDILYESIATVMMGMTLAAAFIACMVCFYTNVGILRRIIMSILLVLAAGIGGSVMYLERLSNGSTTITEEQAASFLDFLQRMGMEDIFSLIMALLAADAIAILLIIILVAFSKIGRFLKHILLSAFFCYGVVPLTLLFLENIIPLLLFAAILAVGGLALKLIMRKLDSLETGSAARNFDSGVPGTGNAVASQKSNVQLKYVDSVCQVFRARTFYSGKGIFTYNGGKPEYLCSQNAYDTGKVRIVDRDRDDMDHSPILTWTPQGAQPH